MHKQKILIYHQGALGDLILSFPALYSLRQHYVGSGIHLVARTDVADIILKNDLADEITSNDRELFAALYADSVQLPDKLRSFLCAFDAAYVFTTNPDSHFLSTIRYCIPVCHAVRAFPPKGQRMPVAAYQLHQLEAAGITPADMPVIGAPENTRPSCPELPLISIHPGSGGKRKCWPWDNYLELIRRLCSDRLYHVQIIFGPAEEDLSAKLWSLIPENGFSAVIIRDKTVAEVASLLKRSSFYIGNDSGITHLAAVLGIPSIAIFGPTDHEVWGPQGGDVTIMRAASQGCKTEVDCSACLHLKCIDELELKDVYEA
ncbi:MAG: glycosyltransferase family 9 protein, partial [Nitrospirae bacterium]|nr:glycosyltransferase family 9 protein [Nitrospirota bacterium]